MPNIKVTRPEFEAYWINRHRRKRRLDTLQNLLFGHGEDGFLFGNFAELDELFTTSTGLANVAASDDPVGLVLDDHGWGGQTLAQVRAASPEKIVNGDGSSATGWTPNANGTVTSFGGKLRVSVVSGTTTVSQAFATVVGRSYFWIGEATKVAGSSGFTAIRKADDAGATVNVVNLVLAPSAPPSSVSGSGYFQATATTTYIVLQVNTVTLAEVADFDSISVKEIPGNHALQATAANRPLWKANAGKPYLAFDGTNDALASAYMPGAVGTVAAAFNKSGTAGFVIAGGTGTGDKRIRLTLGASGFANFYFNTVTPIVDAVDHRNLNTVLAMTWGGGIVRCYVDGALLSEQSIAANMDGAGLGYALAAQEGGGGTFTLVNVMAALTRSVLSTPAEIARITADFQSTF